MHHSELGSNSCRPDLSLSTCTPTPVLSSIPSLVLWDGLRYCLVNGQAISSRVQGARRRVDRENL